MTTVIRFEHVTKSFAAQGHYSAGLKHLLLNGFTTGQPRRESIVLDDVSLEIKRGSVVAFVGRNGAGKSTILSLNAGVIRPNKGRVTVIDRVSSLLELGAGFHPDLTGRENIELYGTVLGFTRADIRARM